MSVQKAPKTTGEENRKAPKNQAVKSVERASHQTVEPRDLVKKIDDRLAVPSYAITGVCGITMWLWQWPTWSPWIITSLVIFTVLTIMGIAFGPFMHKWIALAKDQSPDNQPLFILNRRLTIWWGGICIGAVVILYLMIWKPILW